MRGLRYVRRTTCPSVYNNTSVKPMPGRPTCRMDRASLKRQRPDGERMINMASGMHEGHTTPTRVCNGNPRPNERRHVYSEHVEGESEHSSKPPGNSRQNMEAPEQEHARRSGSREKRLGTSSPAALRGPATPWEPRSKAEFRVQAVVARAHPWAKVDCASNTAEDRPAHALGGLSHHARHYEKVPLTRSSVSQVENGRRV